MHLIYNLYFSKRILDTIKTNDSFKQQQQNQPSSKYTQHCVKLMYAQYYELLINIYMIYMYINTNCIYTHEKKNRTHNIK